MAKRTSDNNGNENLRATGEERSIEMRADAREAPSAERTFQNSASTHANAGVQMLDLDLENSESDALASDNAPIILAQAPQSQGAVATAGPVGGKILGTIQFVTGDVKIVGVDGVARLAQVGDKVAFKETVVTGADGIVQIRLDNGQLVDVGRNAQLALDTDFFGYDAGQGLHAATGAVATPPAPAVEPPAKPAAPGTDVAELQRQIAAGQDPSQIAPATAAGGAPAAGGVGGDGGGGTPVLVDQANSFGPVTAGFNTAGGSIAFPTPEFQLLAATTPPVISVSVQVQVEVVQPAPGETPIPIDGGQIGVEAASVIEGTAPTTQTVNFIIFLDKVFDSDVQVTYMITPPGADGHGADIIGTVTATVTIPAGETSITVPVEIVRDHFVEGNEPFTITLVDADGADINPDQSSAVITIVDDDVNPDARNDTNWTREESALTATGNVLQDHNHPGAPSGSFADVSDVDTDAIHVTTTGTFAGAHGTLVLNADGSYVYTLNNADAAVQHLQDGQTLNDTFNYTITDEGNNTPDSATLNITIFGSTDVPSITVEKTGVATVAEGGTDVTWHFKVTNTSETSDPVTVTSIGDDKLGNLLAAAQAANGGNPIVLASGASFEFDYNPAGVLVLDGGQTNTNVVTVGVVDDEGDTATGTDSHTITGTDVAPSIAVLKTGPATISEGGADVTWHIKITNNSVSTDPVTVTAISDNKLGSLLAAAQAANGGNAIVLQAGASFEFDYNPAGNLVLDGGETHTNIVTVTASDDEGTQTTGQDDHTITGTDVAPTITVDKTGPGTIAEGGTDVTWTFTITNTSVSTDPVTVTAISDDKLGSLLAAAQAANGGQPIVLAAGASFTFTYNPEGNLVLDGGQTHTNVVTVTAVDDEQHQTSGQDSHTITGTDVDPTITVVKSGPPTIAEGGQDVTWSFTITNNSVSTDPVTVTAIGDDKLGSLLAAAEAANGGNPIVLAAGASFSFTYNPEGVLVLDGNETYTNVVTVTAIDDEGTQTTDDDSHTITGTDVAPSIHIEKSSATVFANEGEPTEVTYTYTVTNTSEVGTDPLTITSLIDDNGTPSNPEDDFNVLTMEGVGLVKSGGDQDNLLEQGETWTYSVNRTVTIGEGGNSFTNIAVVTALDNEQSQATDDDDHTIVGDDVPHIGQNALLADEDQLPAGNNDVPVSPGDDSQSNLTGNLAVEFGSDAAGATISFAALHGTAVTDASSNAVTTSVTNLALTYFWNAATETLYASTDTSSLANAQSTAAFSFDITNSSTGAYTFTLLKALEHQHVGNSEDPNIVLSLGYTATDSDGDSAAGSITVTVDDDMPLLTLTAGSSPQLVLDESVGTTGSVQNEGGRQNNDETLSADTTDIGFATISGQNLFTISVNAGADLEASRVYSLTLNAGASGLQDSVTNEAVVLSKDGSGNVEGRTSGGGLLVFEIRVNAGTGDVEVSQYRALEHNDSANHDENGVSAAVMTSGLVQLTATVTDGDGDTAAQSMELGSLVKFEDDGPAVTLTAASGAQLILDESVGTTGSVQNEGGRQNNDETLSADTTDIGFATISGQNLFTISVDPGSDGAGAPVYSLTLNAGASGLQDSVTNEAVVLSKDGSGNVEGRTSGGGLLVFEIRVNAATGDVEVSQYRALEHNDSANHDENGVSAAVMTSGLVQLTATVTDGDGDTAAQSMELGSLVKFEDDGPAVTLTAASGAQLILDESVGTTGSVQNEGGRQNNDETLSADTTDIGFATISGQNLFTISVDPGSDGAGAPVYSLTLNAGATGLQDSVTNTAVTLSMSGGDVVGMAGANLVFKIHVNAATGDVEVSQYRALEHNDSADHDENGVSAAVMTSGLVQLTATVTDGDGDTAAQSMELGSLVKFEDDGPAVTLTLASGAQLILDESVGTTGSVQNEGGRQNNDETLSADTTDIGFATISGQNLFTISVDPGSDGAGAPVYSLTLNAGATGLQDSVTNTAVTLSMSGGDVVGMAGANLVFKIHVNAATGDVEVSQYRALEHNDSADHDENGVSAAVMTSGLVQLTATVTDGDGDTAAQSMELGSLVKFEDDGPAVTLTLASGAQLILDESVGTTGSVQNEGGRQNNDETLSADTTDIGYATLSAQNLFTLSVDAGSDQENAGARAYTLVIENGTTTLQDSVTNTAIALSMSGGDVVGMAGANLVFKIHVNAATGDVEVFQYRAIEHNNSADHDENGVGAESMGAGKVSLQVQVFDNDGDSATSKADLGSLVKFEDDGPAVTLTLASGAQLILDESVGTTGSVQNEGGRQNNDETLSADTTDIGFATISGQNLFTISVDPGSDGAGAPVYSLTLNAGATGLQDSVTNTAVTLSMSGGDVVGMAGANLVFKIHVNAATGDVEVSQYRALEHNDSADHDENGVGAAVMGAGKVSLQVQVFDNDGDSATSKADLGSLVKFEDDGPAVTLTMSTSAQLLLDESVGTTGSVQNEGGRQNNDETLSADTTDIGYATLSAQNLFTLSVDAGSDQENAGARAYTLVIENGTTTLQDSVTNTAIALSMSGGDVVGMAGANLVFKIHVNAATGDVEVFQYRAIEHNNSADHDENGVGAESMGAGKVSLQVQVFDNDGDSATSKADLGSLVKFEDDGPAISATNLAIANVTGTFTGTYVFDVGSDVQSFAASFGSEAVSNPGTLAWTNPRTDYTFDFDAAASNATNLVYHAKFNGGADTFFDIVVKSNGTYDLTMVTPDPTTIVTIPSLLSGISGGSNLSHYLIDGSHFNGQFALDLTGYSGAHAADTITISSTDLGVGDNVMHGNKDDVLRFDVQQIEPNATIATLGIHASAVTGWDATDVVEYTVHYTTGSDTTGSEAWGNDQLLTLTFDVNRTVDWVEITPQGTHHFKIDGVSLSYETKEFPDDYTLNFQLTGSDSDGDSASAAFSVAANTTDTSTYQIDGTTGADHYYGTTGNDTLVASNGNDTMAGGAGTDTFDYNTTTGGVDVITDFNIAGPEVLDLRDVFTGVETRTALELAGKLTFTQVDADGVGGLNDVLVSVNPNGSGPLLPPVALVNVLNTTILALDNDTNIKVN